MHLTTSSSYPRFSRSQYAWALLGLAVLVFTAAVAADNFQAIYAAQKDFVVGSLLSLTGFCFGRALSRTPEQRGGYAIPAVARLALASIQRDLRESLGRRDQAYEWLAAHRDRPVNQELWDVFATMTSDALKADRLLDALLGQYVAFPPVEVLVTAIGYLAAAIKRADEVVTILGTQGIEEPKIFDVMKQDLARAKGALGQVDLQEARSVGAPA